MSNLISNINNFGIWLFESNKIVQNQSLMRFGGKQYLVNLNCKIVNFLELSKYFPEYIIIDIANKFGRPLKSNDKIISSNWMTPLDLNKIILYMLVLYDAQLKNINSDNKVNTNTKPKKRTYKKKTIPITLKRKVWDFWIGESVGKTKCLCCKLTDITQLNFSCGHIISESDGGPLSVQNLKPICGSCNSSMGTQNMNDFIKEYGL